MGLAALCVAMKDSKHAGKVTPACSQVTEAVEASARRRGDDDVKGCQLSRGHRVQGVSAECRKTSDLMAD